jgi:hypothetical protein
MSSDSSQTTTTTTSSSSSSSSSSMSNQLQTKYNNMYELRERIVRFVCMLERRTRLYPAPFHRQLVGGDAHVDSVEMRHSEDVTNAAKSFCVGVFHVGPVSLSSSHYICNYTGWLLTVSEYDELNDEEHENMQCLYGFDVPLTNFVQTHWNPKWDEACRDMKWVVMGDPVSIGGNFNTLSGIADKAYNCEFRVDTRSQLKIATRDGRFSVVSDIVTIHKKKGVVLRDGMELFVAYDNVIKKKNKLQETKDEQ